MTTPGGRRTPDMDASSPPRRSHPAHRRRRRLLYVFAAGTGTLTSLLAASAPASDLPVRTFDVGALAADSGSFSHVAAHPVISGSGDIVAYDAPAPSGSGGQREIYAVDVVTGSRSLVSATSAGAAAGGSSTSPAISANGSVIAFVSTAANLAPGASPRYANVYVRSAAGHILLASGGRGGAIADGGAGQPAVSANGRFVAFTSTAQNLVARDHNHRSDVFVHDLVTGKTVLVSAAATGGSANGWSSNPSISSTGAFASFDSAATNLQGSPRRHGAYVYVRNLFAGQTALVSQTTGGVPQNGSAPQRFRQVSSVSANGQLVAFDSTASNLVRGDTNRRSDVFLRDVKAHTTVLISVNDNGFEGNSDSFSPTISADGTKVAFESFATNLASGGGPVENVFVRDLALGTTSVIDVGPHGQRPSRERVHELLQRPSLSVDGNEAVFESTAANLTGAPGPQTHVFLRLMDPPTAYFSSQPPATIHARSVTLRIAADDPLAHQFDCQVDGRVPFGCGGTVRLSGLHPGRNQIRIRAGGAGMLYQPAPLVATVTVR